MMRGETKNEKMSKCVCERERERDRQTDRKKENMKRMKGGDKGYD